MLWSAAWAYNYYDNTKRADAEDKSARLISEIVRDASSTSFVTTHDFLEAIERRNKYRKGATLAMRVGLAPWALLVFAAATFWIYRGFRPGKPLPA